MVSYYHERRHVFVVDEYSIGLISSGWAHVTSETEIYYSALGRMYLYYAHV